MRHKNRHKLSRRRRREAAEIAARTPTRQGGLADPAFRSDPGSEHGVVRSLPFEFTEYRPAAPEAQDTGGTDVSVVAPLAPSNEEPRQEVENGDGRPTPLAHADLEVAARDAAMRGDVAQATRLYRTLLSRSSDDLNARYRLALLLDQSGDHEEALELLDGCISHDPANVAMRLNRGTVLATVARYAEAESDFREVLTLDPAHADSHFNLGLVEVKRGRWGDAVPHLRRALELDPSNATAYFYLGEALNHVDDIYGALQAYQCATELHPVNPAALYGLGIVLDRIGRPDEATQMYRRSREMAAR